MKTLKLADPTRRHLVAALLLLLLCPTAAAAQAVPDDIPDVPGEGPADRWRERIEERYRGTFSRFFTTGSFDMAPVTAAGAAHQTNFNLGLTFRSGDAVFAFASTRRAPADIEDGVSVLGGRKPVWYYGVGYVMSGTRLLGDSPLARRSALNLGVGVVDGDVASVAVDVAPTYDLLGGDFWSVPAGLKLSLATVRNDEIAMTNAFLGFTIGVQRKFGHRDKLESK
jgi:hypothetical protein